MFLRKARANYSGKAIRVWLEGISHNWEARFTKSQLEKGRFYYKSGFATSIDLSEKEAFVNFKINKENIPYCVIDLEQTHFLFRSSIADKEETNILCCAALYEIEELVCDTMGALPYEELPAENSDADSKKESVVEEEKAREFLLTFFVRRYGLIFCCHMLDDKKKIPIYGKNVGTLDLNNPEKEQLVRLAAFSKKAGFSYEKSGHILRDTSKITTFINQYMPIWKKSFKIESKDNLKALGFGVRGASLSAKASLINGNNSEFALGWNLSLGGKFIDEKYLKHLSGGETVLIPDLGMVKLDAQDESFYKVLERARNSQTKNVPTYMLLSLFSEFRNAQFSQELKDKIASFEDSNFDISGMPNFLRTYQKNGIAWAKKLFQWNCSALLADEMGLGKTVQTLSLINEYCKSSLSAIVVCPASVIPVWESECKKFFPNLTCEVLNSKFNAKEVSSNIILSSYTQIRKNKSMLDSLNFEIAVLDEAQFIKNPEAKTTMACMSLNAKRKIALTGTPIENNIIDLWTIFKWLMPNLLADKNAFKISMQLNGENALLKVRKQIAPFCLRRLKKDVACQLPEKIYSDLLCPLSPLQHTEYQKLLESAKSGLAESMANKDPRKQMGVLALLMRLRQAACDAGLLPWVDCEIKDSGKISALSDRVEELYLSGKKILIFSQFTSFLDRIKSAISQRCPELEIYELTGSTRDRRYPVESFQNTKKSAAILVSLKAGGTGITLTEADYVFFMDPWWNPAVEEQAIDRVHRIGRKGDVVIYRMYAKGTVEDAVRKLQESKKELFEDMFGNIKDVSKSDNFAQTLSMILNNSSSIEEIENEDI